MRNSLILVVIILTPVVGSIPLRGIEAQVVGELPVEVIGELPEREQVGPVAAGRFAVWLDQATRPDLTDTTWYDESDIRGFDLESGEPVTVSDAPGRQSLAATDGSMVVWEDKRHSCSTCDGDIWGRNLVSDEEFPIASGPADQTRPAVKGSTVAWVEADETGKWLYSLDLETGEVAEIVSTSLDVGLGTPVITEDLIVWGELPQEPPYALKAFKRTTKEIVEIGFSERHDIGLSYSADGMRVVWLSPGLMLTDVSTGDSVMLAPEGPASPKIAGDFVVWSAPVVEIQGDEGGVWGIWGLQLGDGLMPGPEVPLVVELGMNLSPSVASDRLVWQGMNADGSRIVLSALLATAFEIGLPKVGDADLVPDAGPDSSSEMTLLSHDNSKTTPTYKGMHAPFGGGWQNRINGADRECWPSGDPRGCPSVDALGTRANGAFFGSYLFIDYDLKQDTSPNPGIQYRITGRCTVVGDPDCGKWGAFAWDVMRYLQLPTSQGGLGKRVVIRNSDTRWPTTTGANTHYQVVDDILQLLSPSVHNYDWIRHIQINNEPNLEWPSACISGCYWAANDVPRTYMWDDRRLDTDFYMAIDDFYTDVWWSLDWHEKNNSNPTIRQRLAAITFWTPPMTDYFTLIGQNGSQSVYEFLRPMIWQYRFFTYHLYPAPASATDVVAGGLKNRSWDFFDTWLRDHINDLSVRSMITEFGWNPDRMISCNIEQHDVWPNTGSTFCRTADGVNHLFESDIHRFLTGPERHKAEAVMVWVVAGWTDRVNALDFMMGGSQRAWFHLYQWSNP